MREQPTVPSTAKTSKSLLLAEDDPLLRDSLSEYLVRRRWHLTAVGTADEASGLVGRGVLYDVVLTDIVMPGRLDGIDLTRFILQERPTAGVIVMSGYTAKAAELKEVVSKGARFWQKPFRLRELDAVIEELLGAGNAEGRQGPLPLRSADRCASTARRLESHRRSMTPTRRIRAGRMIEVLSHLISERSAPLHPVGPGFHPRCLAT